jgi:hypothetical protein
MTLMHAHAVDELRRRIGPDAEPLMHAAGTGDVVALALLERLGQAVSHGDRIGQGRLTAFTMTIRGQPWQGDRLRIEASLPDTVTHAMVGQPLGRVVSGTSCDDLAIRQVSSVHGQDGHWITVDADVIDTAGMRAPDAAMRLRLTWAGARGYVMGGAWAGIGDTMTDVVTILVMLLAGIPVLMTLCLAMVDHIRIVLPCVVALIVAFIARPRRHWRDRVHDHVRGRRTA